MLNVKPVPKPNSKAIDDALGLLAAFGNGGDDTNRQLLNEMKEVQQHNEAVYQELKEAIRQNSQLVSDAKAQHQDNEQQQSEMEKVFNEQMREIRQERKQLDLDKIALTDKETQFSIESSNRESAIVQREQRLKQAEEEVKARESSAKKISAESKEILSEYEARVSELKGIKQRLNNVLASIAD